MKKTTAEKIGNAFGLIVVKIALVYASLYACNVLLKTAYPYDFAHTFSIFIVLTVIGSLKSKTIINK